MSSTGTIGSSTKARILRRLLDQMTDLRDEMIVERIKQARNRAGLSQEDLAHQLRMTTRGYWKWEKLESRGFLRHLDEIAAAIPIESVTAEWLERGNAEEPYQAQIDELSHAFEEAKIDELWQMLQEVRTGIRTILARLDKMDAGAGGAADRAVGRASSRRRKGAEEVGEAVASAREAAG